MQLQSDKSHRLDEIKTQFRAREGYYRLMNSPDYSQRSQRAMGFSTGTTNSNSSTANNNEKTCIKISLVTLNDSSDTVTNLRQQQQQQSLISQQQRSLSSGSPIPTISRLHRRSKGSRDKKICFNVGRELFVYNYEGVRTGPDASNPIYKRSYKGSSPTCHDFNQATATSGSISLLVGFSQGQIQLINLNGTEVDQEPCKEFNTDRSIDKTRVTCVKWLPNSPSLFLVAHASGQLYLYKEDLPCGPAPTYQLYKQSEGVIVYTCKTKTTRNPIYKWTIGVQLHSGNPVVSNLLGSSSGWSLENESCSLNEFVFSPCAKYLACVSQDGFLRVYCYDTMELVGRARSYYGGLTCVCWSPDGKYVVTGGEDDLITVWSFVERRVVARGMGHKSWVSVVAFDSYYPGYDFRDTDVYNDDDDDEDEDDREVDDRDLEGEGDEEEEEAVDEEEEEEEDIDGYRGYNASKTTSRTSRTNRLNQIVNLSEITSNSSSTHPHHRYRAATVRNRYTSVNGDATLDQSPNSAPVTSYRFGSVGQDTQLCLWDLSDDLLKQPIAKPKINSISGALSSINLSVGVSPHTSSALNDTITVSNRQKSSENNNNSVLNEATSSCETPTTTVNHQVNSSNINDATATANISNTTTSVKETSATAQSPSSGGGGGGFLSSKGSSFTKSFSLVGKRDKRNLSQRHSSDKSPKNHNRVNSYNGGGTGGSAGVSGNQQVDDPKSLLGSPICPRMNEVPLIEPSVCKKISFERLTSLIFCKGGFITSCQDGYVFSWARPSRRRSLRTSPGQSNEELRVIDVGTSSAV